MIQCMVIEFFTVFWHYMVWYENKIYTIRYLLWHNLMICEPNGEGDSDLRHRKMVEYWMCMGEIGLLNFKIIELYWSMLVLCGSNLSGGTLNIFFYFSYLCEMNFCIIKHRMYSIWINFLKIFCYLKQIIIRRNLKWINFFKIIQLTGMPMWVIP